jgi:16S rRNA (guanine1207-N2)-methyltransferase
MSRASQDPAVEMLAEYVGSVQWTTCVQLNSGSARVAAAALQSAGNAASSLWCAERYFPAVQAISREISRNTDQQHTGSQGHVFHAHGTYGFPDINHADVATIRIPTEKLSTQQLVWDAFHALRAGGTCLVAGGNNEGVKPAVRMVETLFGHSTVEMQHSGHRLVRAIKSNPLPAAMEGFDSPYLSPDAFRELRVTARGEEWRLFTRPGVFSWEHLDEATTLLVEAMDIHPGESVLDIGAGAGLLGLIAAKMSGTGAVLMLEADSESVRSSVRAVRSAALTNAEVLPSDVTSAAGDRTFDVVVSNPPFHQGKSVDLVLPRRFIGEAWNRLVPGGRLYIVANRTLPYERVIAEQFGSVRVLHDGQRFKVLGATR